jgi:hypothetical protein
VNIHAESIDLTRQLGFFRTDTAGLLRTAEFLSGCGRKSPRKMELK